MMFSPILPKQILDTANSKTSVTHVTWHL